VYYYSYLANNLDLGEYGSRMTVLDGKNRAPFITDAMFTVDVDAKFTESAYLERKCPNIIEPFFYITSLVLKLNM
jgi:hypothetical protein